MGRGRHSDPVDRDEPGPGGLGCHRRRPGHVGVGRRRHTGDSDRHRHRGPRDGDSDRHRSGLSLSAPDSTPHCSGFGTPWQPGMAEGSSDCTIVFGRASAHRASQTTPLRTSATYDVSYTATDGSSGALDPVTVTSTTELPVTEIQTVKRPHSQPLTSAPRHCRRALHRSDAATTHLHG